MRMEIEKKADPLLISRKKEAFLETTLYQKQVLP